MTLLQKQLEAFNDRFVQVDHGPDADDHDCEPDTWNDMFPEDYYYQIEAIKSFLTSCHKETIENIVEMVEKIKEWPEPSPNAGEGGPGALWTSGLLTQYKHDKEKHNKQISDLIASLKEIK